MRVGFAGLGAKFACATGVLFLLLFPQVGKGEPENATPSAPSPSVAQQTIRHVHQVLLLDPAPPEIEAELYDYFLLISERAATGEISPWWAAYLYTSYYRDMLRDRPKGEPRRTREELRAHLQAEVDYYFIRKRPDAAPSPFGAWIYEAIPGQ
jgi:hypothetical protein